LNVLTGFLFDHAADTEPDHLEQGLINLRKWMSKRLDETIDGYVVNNLSEKAVSDLDQCTREITGLIGAAAGTESNYSVEEMVDLRINGPQLQMFDDLHRYRREYLLNDTDCYRDHTCDMLHYDAYATRSFPFGIEVQAISRVQHRWVETDEGYANVQRSWLARPMKATPDWVNVDEQFYLSASIPWDNGGSVRMQAVWAITEFGNTPVPESIALDMAIKQMKEDAETCENWLDTH
jgi:hypothetical protein